MSISPMELHKRFTTGPRMLDLEFTKLVGTRAKEIVAKYRIQYDVTVPIPTDSSLLEAVWEASRELALETGFYCPDTRRRIVVTGEEIEKGLREASRPVPQYPIALRSVGDKRPLFLIAGPNGIPVPEDIYLPLHISYAQEPGVDQFCTATLSTYQGVPAKAGTPAEIMAKRQEMLWAREALKRSGKDDVYIFAMPENTLLIPYLMDMGHMGVWIPGPSADMKLPLANAVIYAYYCTCELPVMYSGGGPFIGLLGGPEVTVLVAHAAAMLKMALFGNCSTLEGVLALKGFGGAQAYLWSNGLLQQNLSRHKVRGLVVLSGAPGGTARSLVNIVMDAVLGLACGASGAFSATTGRGFGPCNGLDHRMGFEASVGMAGISMKEANELLPKLSVFAKQQEDPGKGRQFQECYDLKTIRPRQEWLELYEKTKRGMEALGARFASAADFVS